MAVVVMESAELAALIERAVEKALARATEQGISMHEAAARLNLSLRTIERRVKDGILPSTKIGGAVRIPLSAVLRCRMTPDDATG
jgi:excisionase family DNA binding protein